MLGGRLERGSVLVSATNGKTTTASMLAAVLERSGGQVVHNRAGSNMNWGVATALLDAGSGARADRSVRGRRGLAAHRWRASSNPRSCCSSNLFRDQLDRYGELELLADRWAELVAERDGRTTFVLNADDPLVADLGRERERVVYFGVEDDAPARAGLRARRGLEALPQLRRRVELRGGLPRPHGPLPLPELRPPSGPTPAGGRRRRSRSTA